MASRPSRVLLLCNREGFLARQVEDCLEGLGIESALFRTDTHELFGGPDVSDLSFPEWVADGDPSDYDRAYRESLGELTLRWKPELLIGIGVDGALIAATKSKLPMVVVYGSLDIGFSKRRERLLRRFEQIADRARAFVCIDVLVAHDLIDKGSRVPHFLWKPPGLAAPAPTISPALERVVVFSETVHRRCALDEGRVRELEATVGQTWQLFGCDLGRANRPRKCVHLEDIAIETLVEQGLEGTVCVLLGDSGEHGAIAAAALQAGAPVFMEAELHNRLQAARLPGVVLADKSRLVGELPELIAEWQSSPQGPRHGSYPSDCCPWLDLEHLDSLPWFYEDLDEDEERELVVYASVTGIPRVRDRARAVRIQALLHGMRESTTVVMLQPHPKYVERRRLQLESLMTERSVRLVYVESGTSPVRGEFQEPFFELLEQLRGHGARIGWFARDAHYLSVDFGMETDYRNGLLEAARSEAREVERVADRLYAPTRRLFEHFVEHDLYGAGADSRFMPLPPGTDPGLRRRAASVSSTAEPITVLYCGGASAGVYRMPLYHAMVKKFLRSRRLRFVFISREEELDELRRHYSRRQQRKIQFLSMRLEDYVPETGLTFGVSFFEHPYGKDTVPLKLYSYLSMGFPVLAYDDCSYSSMIEEHGLGLTCPQDSRALRQLFKRLNKAPNFDYRLDQFVRDNAWSQRVEEIRRSLLTGSDLQSEEQ